MSDGRERAREIAEAAILSGILQPTMSGPVVTERLATLIATAVAQAVQAERAACIQVAWEYARGLRHFEPNVGSERVADHIAAALRARDE